MTLQNDLARPWFEPLVPSDPSPPETAVMPAADTPPVEADQLTTRIEGELPLNEVLTPRSTAPGNPVTPDLEEGASPAVDPVSPAERVEVTQPYIPAIRNEQPEFAKRLNPEETTRAPLPPPPVAPTTELAATAAQELDDTPTQSPNANRPAVGKSLFRRVVRRIIGPDLLRKDPPKQKKR